MAHGRVFMGLREQFVGVSFAMEFVRVSNAHDDGFVDIDENFRGMLWRLYRSDPVMQACKTVLCERLLGLGAMYAREGNADAPSRAFYEHIQQHFLPFAKNVMVDLLVQGFSAYTIEPGSTSTHGWPVPMNLRADAIKVQHKVTPLSTEFRAFDVVGSDRTEDPMKGVAFCVIDNPTVGGAPCSSVAAAFRVRTFINSLERDAAAVEASLVRPPIVTETVENKRAVTDSHLTQLSGATGGRGYDALQMDQLARAAQDTTRANEHVSKVKRPRLVNPSNARTSNTPPLPPTD